MDLNYIQNTYNILIKNNLQPEIAQLKKAEIQFHIYNDLDSAYKILDRLDKSKEVSLVSRPPAAAPAVGLMKLHLQQQEALIKEAIGK